VGIKQVKLAAKQLTFDTDGEIIVFIERGRSFACGD
jgi:hypothetical protein